MEPEKAWYDLSDLPPEAQREVVDFVAFLRFRYAAPRPTRKRKPIRLADEAFVGLWRDREDMQDTHAWVRSIREREWNSL